MSTDNHIIGQSIGVRVGHPDDDPSKIKPFVIIESPYMGATDVNDHGPGSINYNMRYARACIRDSILRGEAPFGSHLLYTQPGILRDEVHEERELGMGLGWHIMRRANFVVVYTDLGWSSGMVRGFNAALDAGKDQPIIRRLGGEWNNTPAEAYTAVGSGDWESVLGIFIPEARHAFVIEADIAQNYAVIWKEVAPGQRHVVVAKSTGINIQRREVD